MFFSIGKQRPTFDSISGARGDRKLASTSSSASARRAIYDNCARRGAGISRRKTKNENKYKKRHARSVSSMQVYSELTKKKEKRCFNVFDRVKFKQGRSTKKTTAVSTCTETLAADRYQLSPVKFRGTRQNFPGGRTASFCTGNQKGNKRDDKTMAITVVNDNDADNSSFFVAACPRALSAQQQLQRRNKMATGIT